MRAVSVPQCYHMWRMAKRHKNFEIPFAHMEVSISGCKIPVAKQVLKVN